MSHGPVGQARRFARRLRGVGVRPGYLVDSLRGAAVKARGVSAFRGLWLVRPGSTAHCWNGCRLQCGLPLSYITYAILRPEPLPSLSRPAVAWSVDCRRHSIGRFKATFFASLGYAQAEWSRIENDLRQLVVEEARLFGATEYGTKSKFVGRSLGPTVAQPLK